MEKIQIKLSENAFKDLEDAVNEADEGDGRCGVLFAGLREGFLIIGELMEMLQKNNVPGPQDQKLMTMLSRQAILSRFLRSNPEVINYRDKEFIKHMKAFYHRVESEGLGPET